MPTLYSNCEFESYFGHTALLSLLCQTYFSYKSFFTNVVKTFDTLYIEFRGCVIKLNILDT